MNVQEVNLSTLTVNKFNLNGLIPRRVSHLITASGDETKLEDASRSVVMHHVNV